MLSIRSLLRGFVVAALLAVLGSGALAQERRAGVLLLAHGAHAAPAPEAHAAAGHAGHAGVPHAPHAGGSGVWNGNVEQVAAALGQRFPTEVAFGMADPQTIQAAVRRLEERGVEDIAVVPLFVSSHSPIIGNSRYILRLQPELARTTRLRHLERVDSRARFRFASAMDDHPLVSEILLERARVLAARPGDATVVVIAHGPNDEEENRLWLRDMEAHARVLRERGGFRAVTVLTHRNDAPPAAKAAARERFRQEVATAEKHGEVVVVPLLLSAGGIEAEVEDDLRGLPYRFAQPLLPHPNIARWAAAQAEALFSMR